MDKYLHDPNTVANIIGKDAEMPSMIPFYFKITMLRNKDVKTQAFTLYVGQNHAGYMQTLLAEIPSPMSNWFYSLQDAATPTSLTNRYFYTKLYVNRAMRWNCEIHQKI